MTASTILTVTSFQRTTRETAASLVFGTPAESRGMFTAVVEHDGETLYCSRIDGETEWIIDGLWRGSFPVFHNGEGSRCTALHVANESVALALDLEVMWHED